MAATAVQVEITLDKLAAQGARALGVDPEEYKNQFLAILGNLFFGEPEIRELEDGRREYVFAFDPRQECRPRAGVEALD